MYLSCFDLTTNIKLYVLMSPGVICGYFLSGLVC